MVTGQVTQNSSHPKFSPKYLIDTQSGIIESALKICNDSDCIG